MNDWLVVDASVIIKAFVAEEGSAQAALIWSSESFLAVPAHALAEVGEALRKKRARGEITEEQLSEICLAMPGSFLAIGLDDLFAAAMEIARQVPIGFYDCLYLASAERLDCLLVTADAKLVSAAAGSIWQPRILPLSVYEAESAG
jgi:predicted nucleic acid-binding protein